MDDQGAEAAPQRAWWWLAVAVALIAGFAVTGVVMTRLSKAPLPNACPSDGLIAPDGGLYGRSREDYCCFVDDDGAVDDICRRLRAG